MNPLFPWISGTCLLLISIFLFNDFTQFELKTYESGISSYFFSGIFSRLIISLLLICSVFLWFHKSNKLISVIAIVTIAVVGYILFIDSGNSDVSLNYGTLISSKIKLIILFLFSFFGLVLSYFYPHKKKLNSLPIILSKHILSIGLVTVLFAFNPLFPEEFQDISIKSLTESQQDGIAKIEATDSNKLMAFFTTSCPYCELAAKKLTLLSKNEQEFPEVKIYFAGSEEGVANFFKDTKTRFDYQLIETKTFLQITKGSFPKMIFYSKDKSPIYLSGRSFNYAVVDVIEEHLKSEF